MAADDVLKREDSVKYGVRMRIHRDSYLYFFRDIGALLDYITSSMQNELDPSRIAVSGGSCTWLLSHILFQEYDAHYLKTADTCPW